jgi:hypothetical protein
MQFFLNYFHSLKILTNKKFMDELEKPLLKSKHIIKKFILFKRSFLNKIKERKSINVNIIKFFF